MKSYCETDGESVRVGRRTFTTETVHEGDLDGMQVTLADDDNELRLDNGPFVHYFRRDDGGRMRQYKRHQRMSRRTLQILVAKREKQGWEWKLIGDRRILLPKDCDREYEVLRYGDKFVPHWIDER